MRYRLIAIDLDGTLLRDDHTISQRSLDAIAAAQDAGVLVVPCTGRGWHESHPTLKAVPGLDEGIFVSGVCTTKIATGEVVASQNIEPAVAHRAIEYLRSQPEAVLVLRNYQTHGHEYLVTGDGEMTDNTRWWFELTGCRMHEQQHVEPADLHGTWRVGMVLSEKRADAVCRDVLQHADGALTGYHFPVIKETNEPQSILELFAPQCSKWSAVSALAKRHGIEVSEIAAIGDQINDLPMIERAACGIAMGNAILPLKQAAKQHAPSNQDDGVAYAIGQLLAGAW